MPTQAEKQLPVTQRLAMALEDLMVAIDSGREFPDAAFATASAWGVSQSALESEYDNACQRRPNTMSYTQLIADTNALMNLSREAYEAGDLVQVALCDLALFGHVRPATMDELRGAGRATLADHYGIARDGTTQDVTAQTRAERECLRVIDAARD